MLSASKQFKILFIFVCVPLWASVSASAQAARWRALYVFGDSYSDTGAGYVDGNGPTAVAYLAESLSIPSTYAGDPNAQSKSLNFAVSDPDQTLFFIAGGLDDGAWQTSTTISNLEDEIQQLYAGRYFLIAQLPTRIPAFSAVSTRLNPALATIPQDLQLKLPGAHIQMSKWGKYFDEVIENPSRYGIINAKDRCAGREIFGEDITPCASPGTYFYFHAGHPSTAVHKIVGKMLVADVSNAFPSQPLYTSTPTPQ